MGASLALILSNKSSSRADRPPMRVLLFATERCVREEYGAALRAAGHHLVIAPTRSEAFNHLALRHDGVVVVEGKAPSAAREVLKRARMAVERRARRQGGLQVTTFQSVDIVGNQLRATK
jgi:hypothetical protein